MKLAWRTVRSERPARLVLVDVGEGDCVIVSKMEPCGVMWQ